MARRRGRKGKGRKGSKAIPLLIVGPAILPPAMGVYDALKSGNIASIPDELKWRILGVSVDNRFDGTKAMQYWTPVLLGIVGHKICNRFGINKYAKKLTGGMFQL